MTRGQQIAIGILAIIAFCVLCSLGGVLMYFAPPGDSEAVQVKVITKEVPLGTPTPASICTELRFAEMLGPDDVDTMLREGNVLGDANPISRIVVRFDCPDISPDQISFQWYYNGRRHCTHTYITHECDTSSLTDWDRLPGKFLISLTNQDFAQYLESGIYELVVSVNGKRASSGSVRVNP